MEHSLHWLRWGIRWFTESSGSLILRMAISLCSGRAWRLSLVGASGLVDAGPTATWWGVVLLLLACGLFCGTLNMAVDRFIYKPLRNASKLAPLVSAIGVSFIFMNVGLFWLGPADRSFPELVPPTNLFSGDTLQFTYQDLLVVVVVVLLMVAAVGACTVDTFGSGDACSFSRPHSSGTGWR